MIYLDYAASAPLRKEALQAMLPYFSKTFANPDSLHSFGRAAKRAVEEAREKIASLLGAEPLEVYFTSGGTEANNWAVRGIGEGKAFLSGIEHESALEAAKLRLGGAEYFSPNYEGISEIPSIPEGTGLVACMAVNNETGCIQPIEKISSLAHERGAYFFSDCVQAAPSQDLKKIYEVSDAISLSAHKIGGPKGVGALIVKKNVKISPLLVGGEQERSLRAGTLPVPLIVGFSKALELATLEREEFCAHTGFLRDRFEERLKELVKIDGENRAPNLSHVTASSPAALAKLDLLGVAASSGAACSAHAGKPSHVMLAMGRSKKEALSSLRFSFSLQTKISEAIRAADLLLKIEKAQKADRLP